VTSISADEQRKSGRVADVAPNRNYLLSYLSFVPALMQVAKGAGLNASFLAP
jgi:hypothetical protein